MTKNEFYQLLDEVTESPPGTVTGSEQLADLKGWDSLSVVTFMGATNKEFGVILAPGDLANAKTVGDLVQLVGEHVTD